MDKAAYDKTLPYFIIMINVHIASFSIIQLVSYSFYLLSIEYNHFKFMDEYLLHLFLLNCH